MAGIDVGGTFTDLIALDVNTGQVRLAKVPSTLDNQAKGVMAALKAAECDLAALDLIVHGTTTTTNAVLERKLARTGLITTRGFRDVLELGRRTRPQAYGMTGQFRPLIPRNLRLEVPERMDASGAVVVPLDLDAVREAATHLLAQGCVSVVIHFLHSYANASHERAAAAEIAQIWPNAHITMGHALLSESREFERGVTAAVNASVQPILDRYMQTLIQDLQTGGYGGAVLVMNGNGGMANARHVAQEAAKTVMSGPASGVMAAAFIARQVGLTQLITYDMGGTSSDVALIRGGAPSVSSEIEIEYAMPIHVPMVDVRTVGAGGGSIAQVTASGLLQVGPQSAGADPGPICYGKGGTEPTLSDANLVLGRFETAGVASLGDDPALEHVRAVFQDRLATPLDLDVTQAAAAVVRMANTTMAGAIRMVSLSLGEDPRDFTLFAFGGAGPLHAVALARELGIPRVLVPARPGLTNAIGCVVADLRHDYVHTLNTAVDALDPDQLRAVFEQQIAQGRALIEAERTPIAALETVHSLDMQFVGQTHVLRVPLEGPHITSDDLQRRFEEVYHRRFRVDLADIRANVVNANTSVIGTRPALDLSSLIDPAGRAATLTPMGERRVFFDDGWLDTPVYWRDHLPLDAEFVGPAVIQQMDCTVLVDPGARVTGDRFGNLTISLKDAPCSIPSPCRSFRRGCNKFATKWI
ncbi:MAG: hydantoinase/oxoprolinase family protein [Sedimentitalea sp.]